MKLKKNSNNLEKESATNNTFDKLPETRLYEVFLN